jgi:hypothetical protein
MKLKLYHGYDISKLKDTLQRIMIDNDVTAIDNITVTFDCYSKDLKRLSTKKIEYDLIAEIPDLLQ